MSEIQQFLTGKEVIELHKKVYDLVSQRWHETIYGVGDYEPVEDPAPEYVGLDVKDILLKFPDCEYDQSDIEPGKGSAEISLNEGVLMLDFENDICIESYILSNSELDKMSDDKITSTATLKELENLFLLLYKQYKDPSFKTVFDNLPPLYQKKYMEIQSELLGGNWKFRLKYLLPEESDKLQELFKKDKSLAV